MVEGTFEKDGKKKIMPPAKRKKLTAAEIALDTEGDSLHHYPERLALVQIGLPHGAVWLVDPLALTDLAPLGPLFADARRTLVVHAGDNDLVHLKRRYALQGLAESAIATQEPGSPTGPCRIVHPFPGPADLIEAPGQAVAQIKKRIQHLPASEFLSLSPNFWKLRRQNSERSEGLAELFEAPPLQFDFLR